MKDVLEHLATLREQIGKCEELTAAAKSQTKRAAFARVVAHYRVLASELERAIARMEAEQASDAKRLREATLIPPGPSREQVMRKARQSETGSHMNEWLRSPGLKPPE
ncbi:hypothetical protein RAD16_11605 [Bradyrhizobium sp. 18BD]